MERLPRMVLIDSDGIGYSTMSKGIFNSMAKMVNIFGMPTYENPYTLKVKMIPKGTHQVLTLEMV